MFQLDDDEKPIYIDFAAKALTSGQVNYAAMKRELLAGMFAMETWRSFLLFRKFYWGMDNQALTFLKENKSRVILNWAMEFQEFDFETRFKKGVLNVLPHNLSHLYSVLDLDFGTGEEAGEKSEGSEPVPRKVRSVEEALEEVEIFREDLGDIAAFVNGRGSLVFATFSAETIRMFKSLGKEEPDSQGEKDKIVIECHEGNHVGAKMLFQMILNDGYFWPT